MAPNKKKKKKQAASNPARGFATVSTPSKKVDEDLPEPKDNLELPSVDGKPVNAERQDESHAGVEHGAPHLQDMSPEELEQHLEQAELQSILDIHGQRSKKDVSRQIARLEIERRSLRQSAMMLETEGWLHQVLDEILELARSISPHVNTIKAVEDRLDDTDLCIKLWTVQETLESLHFPNVEGALKHLIKISSGTLLTGSSSLIWGLDEALTWLVLHSGPNDLPAYQQRGPRHTPPASRPRSPTSAYASGETTDTSSFPITRPYSYSPTVNDADAHGSSHTPVSDTRNEISDPSPTTPISDDSDDNDPDQLTDKYLAAQHELLKASLSSKENKQEQQSSDQHPNRLKRRIQKIEHDVLFDRDEAMARWDEIEKDLEVEYARSTALAMRQYQPNGPPIATDNYVVDGELEATESIADNDTIRDDLFGSLFSSNTDNDLDSYAAAAVKTTLRDFGPLGAGTNPRKVLEDVCKDR